MRVETTYKHLNRTCFYFELHNNTFLKREIRRRGRRTANLDTRKALQELGADDAEFLKQFYEEEDYHDFQEYLFDEIEYKRVEREEQYFNSLNYDVALFNDWFDKEDEYWIDDYRSNYKLWFDD